MLADTVPMSNSSEQNGRLPKTAEQAAPPTDPRLRNLPTANDGQRICRDYIWGICLMGERCKHRHELEFEAMKSVLRFCHDYQNRTGCTRPDCTYLHTSREEHELFLSTGQIPRVLADRYAATALLVGSVTDAVLMPPPPPPPATVSATVTQMGPMTMTGPMMGPMLPHMSPMMPMNGTISTPMPTNMVSGHGPMHSQMPVTNGVMGPAMPSMIAPPPPPPPPPVTTAPPTAPVYSAPAVQPVQQCPTVYQPPICQAVQQPQLAIPQLPPMFDPTRPPPPLPAGQIQATKRPIQPEAFNEAGSYKLRKVEGSNDGFCENCFRINLRIEFYQRELEKQQQEEKYNRALYAEKTEEYENGIRLLNTLFNSDVLQSLNVNDHGSSSSALLNDYYSSPAPRSSFNIEEPPVSRNLLLQLVNAFASTYAVSPRTTKELTPPLETRRPQPSQGNDVIAILDLLKTLAESRAQPQAPDLSALSRLVSEPTPGPSRFSSGFVEPERSTPRYPVGLESERTAARYPVTFDAERPRYPGSYGEAESLPGPSRYAPTFPEPPAAPPVPPYASVNCQPAPPQNTRPYYAQPYPQPSTSSSQPQVYSSPGPSHRPEESSTSSQPTNGYPQYMSRLPHQYYQPFQ